MVRRLILAVVLASAAVTAVIAQSNPVEERQALLKEMGRASRPIGAMMKGEAPFELASVQSAIDVFIKNGKVLPGLFPAGSGSDSGALPAVWERNDEFKALWVKFEDEAAKAKVAITDEASLKANFPNVIRACSNCHQSFRKRS